MPKTVKVRVAVAVDKAGDWNAYGGKGMKDQDAMGTVMEDLEYGEAHYWLTAELPVPEEGTVAATVEGE